MNAELRCPYCHEGLGPSATTCPSCQRALPSFSYGQPGAAARPSLADATWTALGVGLSAGRVLWNVLWLFLGGFGAIYGVAILLGIPEDAEMPVLGSLAVIFVCLWVGGWLRLARAIWALRKPTTN